MKRVDYLLRNHDNESRKQGAANPRDRKELKEMRKVFYRAQDRKSLHQLAVDDGRHIRAEVDSEHQRRAGQQGATRSRAATSMQLIKTQVGTEAQENAEGRLRKLASSHGSAATLAEADDGDGDRTGGVGWGDTSSSSAAAQRLEAKRSQEVLHAQ
ncbi:hypothetical protein B0H13DRAFT_1928202 [Mycena leptocephala]|nr:hypothetical protein B0H13DRAFT_1928202 [Mycena leptocephala]